MPEIRTRFAPSTTGFAHPGTLLAALLVYADAHQEHATHLLRFEDLDPDRCTPAFAEDMQAALAWLGMQWPQQEFQHQHLARFEAAMDHLATAGHLYACDCSRGAIKSQAQRAVDGSFIYPGTCQSKLLTQETWRNCTDAIRCRLPDADINIIDESGIDLSQNPARALGDPIVRRKDGAFAYQLVVVVDDAACGINRIIRGRDLMHSTATQIALQELLSYPRPVYRHHLLLLEQHGEKLAKFHKSVSWHEIAEVYSPEAFIGFLATGLGLRAPGDCSLAEFVAAFSWAAVDDRDRCLLWRDQQLQWQAS